jgi:hypothetical protein
VNKKIFATIFRGNKSKSFVRIKPLYCTFTHN